MLGISQRRVCEGLGIHRSVLRYCFRREDDEEALRSDIIRLASHYGRYGYRRIHALLKIEGWHVNHKRVERLVAGGRSKSSSKTAQKRKIVP